MNKPVGCLGSSVAAYLMCARVWVCGLRRRGLAEKGRRQVRGTNHEDVKTILLFVPRGAWLSPAIPGSQH